VQACERNPKLKDIIHRTKVTPDYLWRKAKERDPKLAFKGITIKPTYTEEEKDKRFTFALDMLTAGTDFLHSIVRIDVSSVPVDPQRTLAIGRKGQELLVIDPRKKRDKREASWIHYLLATCWAVGLVKCDILSFTPDYDNPNDPVFHVSAAAKPCPAHHGWAVAFWFVVSRSVEHEPLAAWLGGPVQSLSNLLVPNTEVQVVQPDQAAPCLPCCLVLTPVHALLPLRCGAVHAPPEMLHPIYFNLQPPLLAAAFYVCGAAQHHTEVKATKLSVQHLGLRDNALDSRVCLQQLVCCLGKG
jgi:hypothetical protein